MKTTVYNYIKSTGIVSVKQVAVACNIKGTDALNCVVSLQDDGFLKQCPPIPLNINEGGSCFYEVTNKEFNVK